MSTPHTAINTSSARRLSTTSDHNDSALADFQGAPVAAEEAAGRLRETINHMSRYLSSIIGGFWRTVGEVPSETEQPAVNSDRASSEGDDHGLGVKFNLNGRQSIQAGNKLDSFCSRDQLIEIAGDSSVTESVRGQTPSPDLFTSHSITSSLSSIYSTKRDQAHKYQPLPLRVSSAGPPLCPYEVSSRQVAWEWGWWVDQVPVWKVNPDVGAIKSIIRTYLHTCGLESGDIFVEFLAEGAFNKIYTITIIGARSCILQQCVFRVALGIDPYYKIESDVATTEYVRRNTDIPVPRIYAFDSTTKNELGMEWMLMEKVKGVKVRNYWGEEHYSVMHWDGSNWDLKTAFTRLVADWATQLSRQQFEKIGSLYIDWTRSSLEYVKFHVGRCVHPDFARGKRLCYDIERGPFDSSHRYLQAFLAFAAQDASDPIHKEALEEDRRIKGTLAAERLAKQQRGEDLTDQEKEDEENNDDDPEYGYTWAALNNIPRVCNILAQFLPKMFPAEPVNQPFTMLHHYDLSDNNILVDDFGTPNGVLDWEWTIVVPPQLIASGLPKVLHSHHEKTSIPDHDDSPPPRTSSSRAMRRSNNLEKADCYYKTKLRAIFRAHLEELHSPWLPVYDNDTTTFYVFGDDNAKSRRNEVLEVIERVESSWASVEGQVEKWESAMKEEMEISDHTES